MSRRPRSRSKGELRAGPGPSAETSPVGTEPRESIGFTGAVRTPAFPDRAAAAGAMQDVDFSFINVYIIHNRFRFRSTIPPEKNSMKIRDILKEKGAGVRTIGPEQTIKEAIDLLVQHNIGSLLVTQEDTILGIITERDILRACRQHAKELDRTRIDSIMSKNLVIANPEDDAEEVMAVITAKHIRHMPIMMDGKLAGMISIGDLVKSQLSATTAEIKYLRDYISGNRL